MCTNRRRLYKFNLFFMRFVSTRTSRISHLQTIRTMYVMSSYKKTFVKLWAHYPVEWTKCTQVNAIPLVMQIYIRNTELTSLLDEICKLLYWCWLITLFAIPVVLPRPLKVAAGDGSSIKFIGKWNSVVDVKLHRTNWLPLRVFPLWTKS